MFKCHKEEKFCYQGMHLAILSFAVIAFVLQVLQIIYSNALMTSCYPNETIPWSHFPSKVPFFKTVLKISIILIY